MLQPASLLKISDNSGIKKVACLNSSTNKILCGDCIKVSVRKVRAKSKSKIGEIVYVKVLRTRKNVNRRSGIHIKFHVNEGIILTSQKAPRASRFFGPVYRDLIKKKTSKLVNVASFLL